MQKLARQAANEYATSEAKAGSFVNAWQSSMRTHEVMAENRIKFAARLNEMSEELTNLAKEVDKNRKTVSSTCVRARRTLCFLTPVPLSPPFSGMNRSDERSCHTI